MKVLFFYFYLILFFIFVFNTASFSFLKTINPSDGLRAILYAPVTLTASKKIPLVIGLHGLQETAEYTFTQWKPVADELKFLLVCPQGSNFEEGYSRTPTDDRKLLVNLRDYVCRNYRIDENKIIIAGFSRGGNFAIESGLLYPQKFKNIICIFGFFNHGMDKIVSLFHPMGRYRDSKFYFITSPGDLTEPSLIKGQDVLSSMNILVQLKKLDGITHAYPPGFTSEIRKIQKWMFERG